MSNGELILDASEDGAASIQLRKAVFEEGELVPGSAVARCATSAADGKTCQVVEVENIAENAKQQKDGNR